MNILLIGDAGYIGIHTIIELDKANHSEKDTKHPLLKDFDSPFDIKI